MGVGRNLSYKRALFFKNKGFASHLHIAPGDDDLFINEVANASNTAICCHPDAFVTTKAKLSFAEWFQQKKRHNFAGKYYKKSHQMKLIFFAFSHAMLWFAFFANLFFFDSFAWALSLLGLYWLIKWPFVFYAFKKIKQKGLALWMPIFDWPLNPIANRHAPPLQVPAAQPTAPWQSGEIPHKPKPNSEQHSWPHSWQHASPPSQERNEISKTN